MESDGRSSYQIFLIITYLINWKPVDGDDKKLNNDYKTEGNANYFEANIRFNTMFSS